MEDGPHEDEDGFSAVAGGNDIEEGIAEPQAATAGCIPTTSRTVRLQ